MTLTASETVYFQPHLFAREKKLRDSIALVHTDRKYDGSELAEAILLAALVDAERAGVLRLTREKASRLFGLRKVDALFLHPGPSPPPPPGSYEARLRALAERGPVEVEKAVHAVLEGDHPAPSMLVVAGVLDGLSKRGLVEVREKRQLKLFRTEFYHMPDATKELGAKADGAGVRALLDAWKKRPDQELLERGVRKGIASRKEASDGPD